MRVLVLGSKEYPMGSNRGDDPIPSGGMETYVDDIATALSRHTKLVIVTRKFRGSRWHERKGNIEVYRVPWLRGKYFRNPSFNLFSFLLSCIMVPGRIDLIYCHGLVASFFGKALSSAFGKPLVSRPAGIFYDYPFPLDRILLRLVKSVYMSSDAVIFHSEGEKRNFERDIGNTGRMGEVILTGFPIDKFLSSDRSLRKEAGLEGETVLTFVGRFVPPKGLEYLVEAVSLLKEERIKVLMVGSGPLEKRMREKIGSMGIADRFVFLGFRLDVPRVLAVTDVFLVSSLSEGLPTSLLEAMAAGKPSVVTDIGLVVEDGKTGLVVPPRDPEAFAAAVRRLVGDAGLRKRLGREARRFVEENCTQEKAAMKHMEVFRSALAGRD
jgi:glycosyltransferase involved in cell wall biosynthesis